MLLLLLLVLWCRLAVSLANPAQADAGPARRWNASSSDATPRTITRAAPHLETTLSDPDLTDSLVSPDSIRTADATAALPSTTASHIGSLISSVVSSALSAAPRQTGRKAQPQQPADLVQQASPVPPVLTIGSTTVFGNAATQYLLAPGQTLTPGGVVTLSRTVISLDPTASHLIVDGTTQPLQAPPPALPSTYVVDGNTLTLGGAITVGGTTVSLDASGNYVVVNGVTTTISAPARTTPPVLTVAGAEYSVIPGSGTTYLIDGQVLTPGGIITVASLTIALEPSATALVINGRTTALTSTTQGSVTTHVLSPGAFGSPQSATQTSSKADAASHLTQRSSSLASLASALATAFLGLLLV